MHARIVHVRLTKWWECVSPESVGTSTNRSSSRAHRGGVSFKIIRNRSHSPVRRPSSASFRRLKPRAPNAFSLHNNLHEGWQDEVLRSQKVSTVLSSLSLFSLLIRLRFAISYPRSHFYRAGVFFRFINSHLSCKVQVRAFGEWP